MTSDTRNLVARRYPRIIADIITGAQLTRRDGIIQTLRHVRKIALRRIHSMLFDQPMMQGLPNPLIEQNLIENLTLRIMIDGEREAAAPCSPVPSKTLDWAIKGSNINPKFWHFVDIGSGTGWAIQVALRHGFRAYTGVEFALEMHQKACQNFTWLAAQQLVGQTPSVELRFESAIETTLPPEACVILLFCPFDALVLRPFLRNIQRSVADNPRPILLFYVNPTHPEIFSQRGITEIKLKKYYSRLLRTVSPYNVRVYRLGGMTEFL